MKAGIKTPNAGTQRNEPSAKSQDLSRTQNEARGPKLELQNILVPIDFSEPSKKALSYAIWFAKKNGCRITLLHVVKILPLKSEGFSVLLGSDPFIEANNTLEKVCQEAHVDPTLLRNTLVREGIPHQEIADAAGELEADLIILATHGHTGLAHVLLGSTTERVVRHAPCPVLVVREKEREFLRQ